MEESTFTVEVPAGVEDGSTLRLADRGAAGQRGGPSGSLFVHLAVDARPALRAPGRQPAHHADHQRRPGRPRHRGRRRDARRAAATGHRRRAPSTGTSSGSAASASPTCAGRGRGDFFVHVVVATPTDLSPEQDELLRQFAGVTRRGGRPPPGRGRRGRVLAPALRLWLAPAPPRRGRRAGGGGRPRSSWTIRATRCSSTRTRTTSDGSCGCATARRSSSSDGRGRWARTTWRGEGTLERLTDGAGIGGDGAVLSEPPAEPALTVAFAPVKGERPEWVVQKLTELGVDRIVPLRTERSVVRWDGARGRATVERLRRVAREAAAQCRRVWLPEVGDTVAFADLPALGGPGEVVLAQLSGDRPTRGAARRGRGARGRVEHGRAGIGAADGGVRVERPAGRDGRRDRRGPPGLPPDGDRGRRRGPTR